MSLGHRQHVEAVAIMRRMSEARSEDNDPGAWEAAAQWLTENHPSPEAYMAAMTGMTALAASERIAERSDMPNISQREGGSENG